LLLLLSLIILLLTLGPLFLLEVSEPFMLQGFGHRFQLKSSKAGASGMAGHVWHFVLFDTTRNLLLSL
jgi:hypothetical protein